MDKLINQLALFEPLIKDTQLYKLQLDKNHVYAKLEYQNLMGSVKDRAAYYILDRKSTRLNSSHVD